MPYGVCHGQRARTILSCQHFSQFTLRALRDRPQRHENNINILPPAAANRPITRPVFATERQTLAGPGVDWMDDFYAFKAAVDRGISGEEY